jgi:hypothetical protein
VSSNDNYLHKFRVSIVDDAWIRFNFGYLRDYFGKNHDSHLTAIVTLLETVMLNANRDRNLLFIALTLAGFVETIDYYSKVG